MAQWIVIRNWHRFQHYRDRTPVWIKLYTELLDDPAYRTLTEPCRSLLVGLWILAAKSREAVPKDTRYLSQACAQRVTKQMLERLNHAGFIEFVASKPLASVLAERSTFASARATRANALAREREEQDLEQEQEQVGRQASLRGDQQPPAPPPLPDLATVNGAIGEPPTHLPTYPPGKSLPNKTP